MKEYEKAKMMMANADLGSNNSVFDTADLGNSPFGHFLRTTSGRKLYIENERTGELPKDQYWKKTTKLQTTRQRILYRNAEG